MIECSSCLFFVKSNGSLPVDGHCRRFPPTPFRIKYGDGEAYTEVVGIWPPVYGADYCGEYKNRAHMVEE